MPRLPRRLLTDKLHKNLSRMVDVHYKGPLAERIGEWASRLIDPYLTRHPNRGRERKQIHDPLGRIIELTPSEVYIADSPIFQRLRYVRQLGVGHFLFPTAGYSRFEHSLGAMQTASMMFDSVVAAHRNSSSKVGPPHSDEVFKKQRSTLRLAALLHDTGHCLFSHVSERVYQKNKDVIEAQQFYRRVLPPQKISASETLSLLIVQSDAFQRLLKAARIPDALPEDELARDIMMCIAGSVTGMAPD